MKNQLLLTQVKAKYDHQVKVLLSYKQILCFILKHILFELFSYNTESIYSFIESDIHISKDSVFPNESIIGNNSEDTTLSEQTIYYDILFTIRIPNQEPVQIIINIECQNDTTPGYPLENRMIYYISRLISKQYGTVFQNEHYEKMEKVYSIWICPNPPKYKQDTIIKLNSNCEMIYGEEYPIHTDFYNGILINLSDNESKNELINFLSILLSVRMDVDRIQELTERYHIQIDNQLESEVQTMCNLSDFVFEKGMNKGIELGKNEGIELGKNEGIELGKSEGIKLGKSEGIQIGEIKAMIELVKDGLLTIEIACSRLKMSEEEFKEQMSLYH